MSNVMYVDANRQNSNFHNDQNNEWITKLNTETLLPKGTQIQIQTSFINKKGINGGSIEIDEDILEKISYYFYITENPQIVPVAEKAPTNSNSWIRSSLACDGNTFRGNFTTVPDSVPLDIVYGKILTDSGGDTDAGWTAYNGNVKTPDFLSYGGTGAILPMCKWNFTENVHPETTPQTIPRDDYVLEPEIRTLEIFIKKGVYGIGELGQIIEDQINGLKIYDPSINDIKEKNNTMIRRDKSTDYNVDSNGNPVSDEMFDGQLYNRPLFESFDVFPRYFQTSLDAPEITTNVGGTAFLNMEDYIKMAEYLTTTDTTMASYPKQGFTRFWMRGLPAQDAERAADTEGYRTIKPFYMVRVNYDTGAEGSGGSISKGHKDESYTKNYNLYGYNDTRSHRKKLIGTADFSFKYDSEKNGYSINGLHNNLRGPSHDRYGNKVSSAGQTVVNFKKIRSGGITADNAGTHWATTDVLKVIRNKIIGALNTPETRDMGVMIINFGVNTCQSEKTTTKVIPTPFMAKFDQFFNNISEAQNAWKKTIWYRLGFDYEQLNESTGTSIKYDRGSFPDYGFTTDSQLTNDIIPTISTLNNPLSYKPVGADDSEAGFQLYNTMNTSITHDDFNDMAESYSNSPYYECLLFPVIISDVGGVIGRRLPALSKHPYYLITTDLCDNYKDNVKKGDVLPLIGVVPKTSLSNQDFITAENQIIQVLSQDKVINKFNIKILNPDLTAPILEENSSIILKLTLPNITPLSLLEEDPTQKNTVKTIIQEQNELVGF